MEYQVPQFIEVENKIVGPLTLKQFIYIAGAAGFCVLFFLYLPIIFAVIFSLPIVALAAALAFYKMNGKPFIEVLESGFNYYTGAKLFLWKHQDAVVKEKSPAVLAAEAAENAPHTTVKMTQGKLSELARSLDISSGEAITSGTVPHEK